MGTKAAAKKQSKAAKIVLATIKTLSKAKDLYMLSMERFGNGLGGNPNPQASSLARSHSISSATKESKVADQTGLQRSMSESRRKPNYGVSSYVPKNNHKKELGYRYDNEMKRSCRAGEKNLMMMRRIDEDKSCSFREDDVASRLLYPRSRSYSVKQMYEL